MTTATGTTWQRVSKRRRCPVCGRPDWCLFAGDPEAPEAVICPRIESSKRCGDAGWLHRLREGDAPARPRTRRIPIDAAPAQDFRALAERYRAAVDRRALAWFADGLGLSVESLHRLGIGRAPGAWAFPMTDARRNVRGVRLRTDDGRKLSVRGGREGLSIPDGLDAGGALLAAEGPTDTAALLDLGFGAVGRPSNQGGVRLLVDLVHRLVPERVVIVADHDEPGQRGAHALASVLVAHTREVRIVTPPETTKDARAWKHAGATRRDIERAIEAAPAHRLKVRVKR